MKILQPTLFQGKKSFFHRNTPYFEGWYYKQVSEDQQGILSFIPGVAFGSDPHSFVQMINGKTGETRYYEYPLEAFSYRNDPFEVTVDNSRFTTEGLHLDLQGPPGRVQGELAFQNRVSWPGSLKAPGIMGWYTYVPFMECYHGVVSLNHQVKGSLELDKKEIDFSGGRGYIEKDWGKSMPSSWVWIQSNNFDTEGTSFMLSVARIPWLKNSFVGFLGFLYHQGQVYPLATWKGHRLRFTNLGEDGVSLNIALGRREFLVINGTVQQSGALKAPVVGEMKRVIKESVSASLEVRGVVNGLAVDLNSSCTGLEIVNYQDLL